MSRDLERAVQGDRSIPWERAASYFVRIKKASVVGPNLGEDAHGYLLRRLHELSPDPKEKEKAKQWHSAHVAKRKAEWEAAHPMKKQADLGNPQSMPEGERMGGYGSNYGKIDPGSLISEGVRERTRPEAQQPNIHDAEGMGVTPEELEYQRAMARVQDDAELGQIQAENEAAFMEQKLQETSQRAEMAEASAEQAGQQAQQAQQAADQATQQLQQTQQEMGAQLQQSQTQSMAANEELMRLRQGIQDFRQQLQQLALSDPTAPPAPPQVDPATGQPMDQAAAPGPEQAPPGQEQAPPQAPPGQEAMPKQSEAVPPMLAPGSAEMPPGMPAEGEMAEEEMGPEDIEGQLAQMEDDELMELLDAVQGELAARDQEEAKANDAEHQHAMGLAEGAVAASKTASEKKEKKDHSLTHPGVLGTAGGVAGAVGGYHGGKAIAERFARKVEEAASKARPFRVHAAGTGHRVSGAHGCGAIGAGLGLGAGLLASHALRGKEKEHEKKAAAGAKKVEEGFERMISQVRKMRQDARQLRRLQREAGHGTAKEIAKGVALAGAGGAAGGTIGYLAGKQKGQEEAFKGAAVRRPFVKTALAGVDASKAPSPTDLTASMPDIEDKTKSQITTPAPKHARVSEGGSYEKRVTEQPTGMLKAEKTAEAINYIPPRRYGISTDHTPGQLEKNSDWGQRAAGAAIGGLAAAGIQGLSNRAGKAGKSDKEIVLAHRLKELEGKKDKGIIDKYKTVMYRAAHDTAKINREHPQASAVIAGLTGATAGAIAAPAIVRGVKGILQHVARK